MIKLTRIADHHRFRGDLRKLGQVVIDHRDRAEVTDGWRDLAAPVARNATLCYVGGWPGCRFSESAESLGARVQALGIKGAGREV